MIRTSATVAMLIFVALPTIGLSQVPQGRVFPSSELLRACTISVRSYDSGSRAGSTSEIGDTHWCLGYLQGALDTMLPHPQTYGICFPPGISTGQTARMIVKHLQERPERLHHPAIVELRTMLSRVFPCT